MVENLKANPKLLEQSHWLFIRLKCEMNFREFTKMTVFFDIHMIINL